jgi:hypothetical protein
LPDAGGVFKLAQRFATILRLHKKLQKAKEDPSPENELVLKAVCAACKDDVEEIVALLKPYM